MPILEFTGSILLLLMTPGPTNTLMALAGYSRGILRSLPLILAEVTGYLAVVIPVATVAAPFLSENPTLSLAAKLGAALWVLFLSYRLWSANAEQASRRSITGKDVLVTTMLNPKALIIAVVIIPHRELVKLFPWLGLFAGLIVVAASGWIALGHSLSKGGMVSLRPHAVQRIAATCLLLFAALLTTSSIRAMT